MPVFRKTLLDLQAALRDPVLSDNPFISGVPVLAHVQATTLDTTIEQLPGILQEALRRAVEGLDSLGHQGQFARRNLAQAVSEISQAMRLVGETAPAVWLAVATGVADLQALNRECDALGQLIDLPLTWQGVKADKDRLLGHEWRVFVAAYNAEMVGRMAAMCRHPQHQLQPIAAVPEDLRRHFYTQWFGGFRAQYAYGHEVDTQGHDKEFLEMPRSQSTWCMVSLWEHFARLTAWRVAESQATTKKQRMRRLTRTKVLALRDQGVSVEEIAHRMRTTPKGVLAAISRWEAKLDAKGQVKSAS